MTNEEPTLSHRLQILSTEHWSLLASRSLAWSESFNRAAMFLATLSGAVVALALVAQVSSFGRMFSIFALIILPLVLFIGITTVLRLGATNYHDSLCVMGMNRIRHAYLEMAPDLETYFVMSAHDDPRGVAITMGLPPFTPFYQHVLAGTPIVIIVINSIISGVIGSIGASLFTAQALTVALAGVVGFLISVLLHRRGAAKNIKEAMHALQPRFPGEDVTART